LRDSNRLAAPHLLKSATMAVVPAKTAEFIGGTFFSVTAA
jgi:hypothetical protein